MGKSESKMAVFNWELLNRVCAELGVNPSTVRSINITMELAQPVVVTVNMIPREKDIHEIVRHIASVDTTAGG